MIKVLELFGGYGSQALALENLGIDFKSDLCEIDKYAIQAYNQLHGETFNYGDICSIDETKLPYYDLITYSSPCQDFSVAGKQAGGEKGSGTRSSLLWECERIIRAVKPKYLLMENVKALVGKKFYPLFCDWLRVLQDMGYKNYWKVLNAKDYGVPQNRERVFVVSILGGGQYQFPEPIPLTRRLKDVLEQNVDEKYYLSDKIINGFLEHNKHHEGKTGFVWNPKDKNDVAVTIRANCSLCPTDNTIQEPRCEFVCGIGEPNRLKDGKYFSRNYKQGYRVYSSDGLSTSLVSSGVGGIAGKTSLYTEPLACASRGRNPDNPSDRTQNQVLEQRIEVNETGCSNTLTSVAKDNYVIEPKVINPLKGQTGNGWHFEQEVYDKDGIARAVKAGGGSGNIPKVMQEPINLYPRTGNPQAGRVYNSRGISPSMDTCQGGNRMPKITEQYRIRKLTPRECWRLQGVKDEQFDKLHDISNSQLYKLAGNSIVVDVLMGIFKNMFEPTEQKGQLELL